ncbi:ribosomal biogenesis protein LAS1L isoform X2 [Brachyhypopomus gauderio]|uniref:ribosomal biogenesis protein LAS1L isoform X2 n=1 Tax=Brachyhypopomus gauderio TaxID=698409 RepID=UPI00404347DB
MKKKSARKTRHVVAWMNKGEWDQVLEHLYSRDPALQNHALHRVSAWRARFGHKTPVAVESTANLVRCQVLDNTGKVEGGDLVLLYGMALTRFVNLILERQQGRVARPLRHLASSLNIPEWIVNLRHDITHRRLPPLRWCRKGCEFVLKWLQQEYWSRQLNSQLIEDWNSSSEEEEDEEEKDKNQADVLTRQRERARERERERELHKRARELLISYEQEQFQVGEVWRPQSSENNTSTGIGWILTQIQQFGSESGDILIDVLVHDGFLIPTAEQLESLDINPSEELLDLLSPHLPRELLRFWLPLLRVLSSASFINLILERLFAELSNEPTNHRMFYLSAWISEFLHCNSKSESKALKRVKMMKERIFVSRVPLACQDLLSACLTSPCPATPFLLQQILTDMDKPLPTGTQHNLLHLCSIYTQSNLGDGSPGNTDPSQPVYTVESLHERLEQNRRGHSPKHAPGLAQAPPTQDIHEHLSAETIQEQQAALRGSPWSVCTDKVPWKQYPLGKVPGQTEDPSCLMVETYSTLTVFDQQVELDQISQPHAHTSAIVSRTGSDGPLWTHSDLSKLKMGLKLY